jgi:hypothetical protein
MLGEILSSFQLYCPEYAFIYNIYLFSTYLVANSVFSIPEVSKGRLQVRAQERQHLAPPLYLGIGML